MIWRPGLTKDSSQEQYPEVFEIREYQTRKDHESRTCEQNPPTTNAIRDHGQKDPEKDISEKR